MKRMRPDPSTYATAFARYVQLVPEENIVAALESQGAETQKLLRSIDESRATFRYAAGKWSIKQIVGHLEDCERVFAYRVLTVARHDTTPLPGFDENSWMEHAPFDATTLRERADALALVRSSTGALVRALDDDAWDFAGNANDHSITVRALVYIIVGHERHHLGILRERYLASA